MAANSERDAGYRIARAVILTLLWVLFVTALAMSARQGVALAKERLSSGESNAIPFAPGTTVTVDARRKAVAFGESAEVLREYFLTFAVRGGAGPMDERSGVHLLKGRFRVNALEQDGNLVKVRIASGQNRGEVHWVRRDRIRLVD